MSYELQVATDALKLAQNLRAALEENLGDDFKQSMNEKDQQQALAVEAAKPLELTPEEKLAIINARLDMAAKKR
jgi:hypothetical protein